MLKKILGILLIIGIVTTGTMAYLKYKSSGDMLDPLVYFEEFKEGQQNMVFNDTRVDWEQPAWVEGGEIYLEAGWVHHFVDDRVYYDQQENILTITNLEEVIRVYPILKEMTINGVVSPLTIETKLHNNHLYIHEDALESRYAFEVELGNDGRLAVAGTNQEGVQSGTVRIASKIRTHADHKSHAIDEVKSGESVLVYGQTGKHLRVRNENGWTGYLPQAYVKIKGEPGKLKAEAYTAQPIANPLGDKVKLIWDQMTVRTAGDWESSKYTQIQGANVISPTWFEFADASGLLMDRGTKEYVEEARKKGLQVWPLMSHNFSEPQFTREILTSTSKRQYVIDQLVELTQTYDVQGLNIDIENIQEDFGTEWVQFMRELYPQMQAIGKTVSVDVYMPSAWSKHYHRDKISEVVDYFMVMAYDQHWAGSEEAGPTAGLTWVEEGIKANLEEVPAEKLVLGLPFFTRVWERTGEELSSKAYAMGTAKKTALSWGTPIQYDTIHQQNYTERQVGDSLQQIWIEDETIVSKRIALINQYDLAGYAGWKLGLENKEVWTELEKMK